MSQYGSYGPRRRTEERKKKRMNVVVNTAIAIVLVGIVFVSGMLIFGGKDSETATTNNGNENNELNENNEQENDLNGVNENNDDDDRSNVDEENDTENNDSGMNNGSSNVNDRNDNTSNDSENDENENNYNTTPVAHGEWEPIGTVQEEPFTAVFEQDHVNWEEMRRAMQYATGLGDNMTIWWLGNGGDHQSAEGYVSDYATRDTPYKVRLEWVTNEGWMPVSVE